MKRLFKAFAAGAALAALSLTPTMSSAADDAPSARPTFYKDVLPIMQVNCQDCHRPSGMNLGGMVAPMALMTYQEVRPWAKSIAKLVSTREMPPWHAAPNFHGTFKNERTLTENQIATIVRWANTSAPAGDEADAPEPIKWPETSWAIGEPDLIITFDEPFEVKDDVEDLNVNLSTTITKEMLPEDKFITGIEFRPGSAVVHHIIGFSVPPAGADARGMQMIGGIAPGTAPSLLPEGYGVKLHTGANFVFQMHYHKEPGPGTGVMDQSSIGFRFADKPVNRLYIEAVGNPRELYVPAGQKAMITGSRQFDRDITVISLLPHMHLRGDYAKYRMKYPDGREEDILEVPKYDFNWQTGYSFMEPKAIPAGTTLEVTLGFDNTTDNAANPDPTKDVRWGSATTDEMNLGWITWAYTNPTDNDPIPRSIGGQGRGGPRGQRGQRGGGRPSNPL